MLYLDSIRLGCLSLEHNCFPRIRVFPYDTMRCMIAADNNFTRYERGMDESMNCKLMLLVMQSCYCGCDVVDLIKMVQLWFLLCCLQIRDAMGCCYYWSHLALLDNEIASGSSFVATWETSLLWHDC